MISRSDRDLRHRAARWRPPLGWEPRGCEDCRTDRYSRPGCRSPTGSTPRGLASSRHRSCRRRRIGSTKYSVPGDRYSLGQAPTAGVPPVNRLQLQRSPVPNPSSNTRSALWASNDPGEPTTRAHVEMIASPTLVDRLTVVPRVVLGGRIFGAIDHSASNRPGVGPKLRIRSLRTGRSSDDDRPSGRPPG